MYFGRTNYQIVMEMGIALEARRITWQIGIGIVRQVIEVLRMVGRGR